MSSPQIPAADVLRPWTGREREDFFQAVARHQRKAWRITAVCLVAYALLAIVMSVLLAPLLYCLLGLGLDVLNRLTPMPDLLKYAGNLLAPIIDNPETLPLSHFVKFIVLASAPGLLLMLLIFLSVRGAVRHSAWFAPQTTVGRSPSATVLAEQQFANTVAEMAVAAILPNPNVRIIAGGANAAVTGIDAAHASIFVGEDLLKILDRSEMQGVAAHLVASIANDDIRIGLRTASLLGIFALIARLAVNMSDKANFRNNLKLIKAMLYPGTANQAFLLSQLSDPFSDAGEAGTASSESPKLGWYEWLTMPLMGPVWMSGFLGGFVNSMLLTPAIAFAWRQRKYMADATAVRLTREPNALYSALAHVKNAETKLLSTAWASHLCVVSPGNVPGMIVSVFPSFERRLAALVRLGADQTTETPRPATASASPMILLLVGGLSVLALGLMLALIPMMAMLSTMLTGFFTLLPAALLHALLR